MVIVVRSIQIQYFSKAKEYLLWLLPAAAGMARRYELRRRTGETEINTNRLPKVSPVAGKNSMYGLILLEVPSKQYVKGHHEVNY